MTSSRDFVIPSWPGASLDRTVIEDPPSEGVTPSHPCRDLDEGDRLSEATAPPSLTLGQTPTVEPDRGFPGRGQEAEQKAQRKAELAAKKRQAKTDAAAAKASAKAEQAERRHREKVARIERKKAERIPLAERNIVTLDPLPVHRSWWFLAAGVAVTTLSAVGVVRATGTKPLNIRVDASAPVAATETSEATTTTFQLANPLAAVPFPLTTRAARFIGGGRPPVAVTLGDGTRVSLSYPSLKAISEKMGSGPKDPCILQLDVNSDPAEPLGLKVVTGTPDGIPLFDCTAPATVGDG